MKQIIYIILSIFWLLNDIYFKSIFHNELTGKLSDILGLIVFPELLNLIFSRIINITKFNIYIFSYIIAYLVFIFINVSQFNNNLVYTLLFQNQNGISDPTDLYCIPIATCLSFLFNKYLKSNSKSIQEIIFVLTCSIAFFATSYLPPRVRLIKFVDQENKLELRKQDEVHFIWYTFDCEILDFNLLILTEDYNKNLYEFEENKVINSYENYTYTIQVSSLKKEGMVKFHSLEDFYLNKIQTKKSIQIHLAKNDFQIKLDERINRKMYSLKIHFPIPSEDYKFMIESNSGNLKCKNEYSEKHYDSYHQRRTFVIIPFSQGIDLKVL